MRILGIDYGSKHIGLAVSDESRTIARELGVFSPKEFWQKLAGIVTEQNIKRVVVGLPIGLRGQNTKSTEAAQKFIDKLKKKNQAPVETVDERFTTDLAKRLGGGHGHHDSLVAQILLQEYLNKNSSKP